MERNERHNIATEPGALLIEDGGRGAQHIRHHGQIVMLKGQPEDDVDEARVRRALERAKGGAKIEPHEDVHDAEDVRHVERGFPLAVDATRQELAWIARVSPGGDGAAKRCGSRLVL